MASLDPYVLDFQNLCQRFDQGSVLNALNPSELRFTQNAIHAKRLRLSE